jgi:hypothetical protein
MEPDKTTEKTTPASSNIIFHIRIFIARVRCGLRIRANIRILLYIYETNFSADMPLYKADEDNEERKKKN